MIITSIMSSPPSSSSSSSSSLLQHNHNTTTFIFVLISRVLSANGGTTRRPRPIWPTLLSKSARTAIPARPWARRGMWTARAPARQGVETASAPARHRAQALALLSHEARRPSRSRTATRSALKQAVSVRWARDRRALRGAQRGVPPLQYTPPVIARARAHAPHATRTG
jgi:hypothetical protein